MLFLPYLSISSISEATQNDIEAKSEWKRRGQGGREGGEGGRRVREGVLEGMRMDNEKRGQGRSEEGRGERKDMVWVRD